ncbi:FAD/NAD(P)-binding protein, partial [Streptomyces albidoflavus]
MSTTERPRILVVGGGYVGLYAARRILKKMRYAEATVTVVDPRSYMTYQPFLPEAAAGSISPRHVVVPLRRVVRGAEVLTGRVTTIDQD